MANALYPAGKRAMMNGDIDLAVDGLTIALVDTTYTYSATHTSYTTNISADEVATTTLTGGAVLDVNNNAAFDAADPTFTAVSGNQIGSAVIYHTSSGTPIAYIDEGAGLPFTPNGGDITVNLSNGNDRVFAL